MSPITLRVREVRKERGDLTQAALAAKAGVSVITISNLERQPTRQRVDLVMVQRIAAALEVPLTELIAETPAPKRRRS